MFCSLEKALGHSLSVEKPHPRIFDMTAHGLPRLVSVPLPYGRINQGMLVLHLPNARLRLSQRQATGEIHSEIDMRTQKRDCRHEKPIPRCSRDSEVKVMNATIHQWRYGTAYGTDLFRNTAANLNSWRPY